MNSDISTCPSRSRSDSKYQLGRLSGRAAPGWSARLLQEPHRKFVACHCPVCIGVCRSDITTDRPPFPTRKRLVTVAVVLANQLRGELLTMLTAGIVSNGTALIPSSHPEGSTHEQLGFRDATIAIFVRPLEHVARFPIARNLIRLQPPIAVLIKLLHQASCMLSVLMRDGQSVDLPCRPAVRLPIPRSLCFGSDRGCHFGKGQ